MVRALATVTYLPTAADDESLDNPAGSTVTVPILGNDVGLFDTSTARLLTQRHADDDRWSSPARGPGG